MQAYQSGQLLIPTKALSDIDTKIYTHVEFCKIIIKCSKKVIVYKTKQSMLSKSTKTCMHFLEYNASGVQVGDVEQVIVQYLYKV